MRFGITVLVDDKGEMSLYPGKGDVTLPMAEIADHKEILKRGAVSGLKIGGKVFTAGYVVSQYGIESRKKFPVIASKRAK